MKWLTFLLVLIILPAYAQEQEPNIRQDSLQARLYFAQGDSILGSRTNLDSSIYYFEKASVIYQVHELWIDYYSSQNKISENLWRSGKYDESLDLSASIAKKLRETGYREDASLGKAYNNMGIVYGAQGNYEKALEFYQKSLGIRLTALGPEHPDVGVFTLFI